MYTNKSLTTVSPSTTPHKKQLPLKHYNLNTGHLRVYEPPHQSNNMAYHQLAAMSICDSRLHACEEVRENWAQEYAQGRRMEGAGIKSEGNKGKKVRGSAGEHMSRISQLKQSLRKYEMPTFHSSVHRRKEKSMHGSPKQILLQTSSLNPLNHSPNTQQPNTIDTKYIPIYLCSSSATNTPFPASTTSTISTTSTKVNKNFHLLKMLNNIQLNTVVTPSKIKNSIYMGRSERIGEVRDFLCLDRKLCKKENLVQMNIRKQTHRKVNSGLVEGENLGARTKAMEEEYLRMRETKLREEFFTPKTYQGIEEKVMKKSKKLSQNQQQLLYKYSESSRLPLLNQKQLTKQPKFLKSAHKTKRKTEAEPNKPQNQAQKYLNMHFSRYTVAELRSLHEAILNYAQGDIEELKKALVVVMNLSGILIEEDKLERISFEFQLESVNPDNAKQNEEKDRNTTIRKQIVRKYDQLIAKSKAIIKYSNNPYKQIVGLPSKGSLKTWRTFKNMELITEKNIEKKRSTLNESMKKIIVFDNFLQIYKTIQTHYFKQTIIDYLQILLGGCMLTHNNKNNTHKQNKIKTTTKNLKNQTSSRFIFQQQDPNLHLQVKKTQFNPILSADNSYSKLRLLSQQSSCTAQPPSEQQIGYSQIFQAFSRRYSPGDALKISQAIQAKVISSNKQPIKTLYYSTNTNTNTNNGNTVSQSVEMQIGQQWRIPLSYLYRICYQDNQLCQLIYEYYMREVNGGRVRHQKQPVEKRTQAQEPTTTVKVEPEDQIHDYMLARPDPQP